MPEGDTTTDALKGLIDKIIVYRFTRNVDRELKARKIAHSEVSEACGRAKNWFNNAFNGLEDMRVSTFLKLFTAMSKLSEEKKQPGLHPPVLGALFDDHLLRLSALALDLRTDDIEELADLDPTIADFLVGLRVYIDALKRVQKKVTAKEISAFENVLKKLESKR